MNQLFRNFISKERVNSFRVDEDAREEWRGPMKWCLKRMKVCLGFRQSRINFHIMAFFW